MFTPPAEHLALLGQRVLDAEYKQFLVSAEKDASLAELEALEANPLGLSVEERTRQALEGMTNALDIAARGIAAVNAARAARTEYFIYRSMLDARGKEEVDQ